MHRVTMTMRACLTAVAVSAATLGLPAVGAQAAAPAPVAITCGATVTGDAYLAADLACPSGDGVKVDGNATIDLAGHKLTGTRAATGVVVKYGASVRLQRGRLTGWGTGITVRSAELHPQSVPATIVVYAMNFVGNGIGVAPGAIQVSGDTSPTIKVAKSYFTANDIGVGGVVDNSATTITTSNFIGNRTAGVSFSGDVFTDTGSVVMDYSFLMANKTGVLCSATFCILRKNTFQSNPTGVRATNTFTFLTMEANTVSRSELGVRSEGNRSSNLTGNTFQENKFAVSFDQNAGRFVNNIVTHNQLTFSWDTRDALFPDAPVALVSGNTSTDNDSWGMSIRGPAIIKNNVATGNTFEGIYAPYSTDGGGNRASGNGNTPQCVGVVCT